MKLFIISLFVLFQSVELSAQSLGIGTTSPHASSQLDIRSTTKGLLIPSMTSTQRTNISSPPEGLMVYDLTDAKMYQHQDGVWRYLINNDYWTMSSTHNWVYNLTDSVGIGTANVSERLHVLGNTYAEGDLLINGGGLTTNNTGGTLQFQNAGANKTYVQLSGNNLRMGTNSGNTAGNMIIRMNGTDRIFIDELGRVGINEPDPRATLDVGGNMNLTGSITKRNTTFGHSLVPIAYGKVDASGNIISGSGNFTVTSWGVIDCPGMTNTAFVFANPISDYNVNVSYSSGGSLAPQMFAYKGDPVYTYNIQVAYQFVIFRFQ